MASATQRQGVYANAIVKYGRRIWLSVATTGKQTFAVRHDEYSLTISDQPQSVIAPFPPAALNVCRVCFLQQLMRHASVETTVRFYVLGRSRRNGAVVWSAAESVRESATISLPRPTTGLHSRPRIKKDQ